MTRAWDAESYHRVSDPQFNWGRAVLAAMDLRGDERVIDLGCGTGRLTAELAARLPGGEIVALDASRQMLEQARLHLADVRPAVRFVEALLPALPFAGVADVAFSTATFHWVRNHPELFTNVFRALKRGGMLHAQCGGGQNLAQARAPAEAAMQLPRFSEWFTDWQPIWEFADHRVTADRLARTGFTDIATSLEAAPVTFDDEAQYRAFVSTVVFRLHLARLPEELRMPFLDEIVVRLPKRKRFTLDYWRLNMHARRP
ncbi:MAG TPA: class I SAM-dependent methyltransferase [Vicinamibacterales bacterium]|nr:class I SAM-dependent methyltransferase [Vicinamibacterales bacterium]